MKKQLLKIGCLLSVLFLFTSCVKDDVAYLVVKLEDTESFYSRYEVSHFGSWCLCEDRVLADYVQHNGSWIGIEKVIFPPNYVKYKFLEGECFRGVTPKNVSIPSSVTWIREDTFSCCFNLTSVDIPSSVFRIDKGAFRGCKSLTSVEIPSSVTEIGYAAFFGCSSLTSIEIPSSVTEIERDAFWGCKSLKSMYLRATTPPSLGSSAFSSCPADFYVPMESVEAYKNAEGWSEYASRIVGY